MFCKHCGIKLPDDAKFCPSCGHTLTDEPHETTPPASPSPSAGAGMICCPECGSRDLQYVTDTDFSTTVKNKGYSGSKGCLGFLMFGPLGMLCGNCGSGKSTTTTSAKTSHGWVCKNCGNKFRDKKELEEAIRSRKNTIKGPLVMEIVLILIFLLGFGALGSALSSLPIFIASTSVCLAYLIVVLVAVISTKMDIRKLEAELDEFEKKMARYR